MSSGEAIDVVQLGLSGPVAEKFREIAGDPRSPLHLTGIATASHPELIGKRLGQTGLSHPSTLDYVPIVDLDDVPHMESEAVFSGLQTDEARHRELAIAEGRWLFTNASPNRMQNYAALYNAYVGGSQLEELNGMSLPGRIVAGGNCVAIPLSMVTAPLNRALGVTSMKVVTLQGWSGKGLSEVPKESMGEMPPITGDEQQKIEEEPNKFLGSIRDHDDITIHATPQRGSWVYGHHLKVRFKTKRPTSKEEVVELLEDVRMPEDLANFRYGKNGPQKRPLRVTDRSLLKPADVEKLKLARQPKPMRADVHVKKVSEDGQTIKLEIVGDNLVLGASGSNVMNMIHARAKGLI